MADFRMRNKPAPLAIVAGGGLLLGVKALYQVRELGPVAPVTSKVMFALLGLLICATMLWLVMKVRNVYADAVGLRYLSLRGWRLLSWSEVAEVRVSRTLITVRGTEPTARLPLSLGFYERDSTLATLRRFLDEGRFVFVD